MDSKEQELFRRTTIGLRRKDRSHWRMTKPQKYNKYYTPWDIERIRFYHWKDHIEVLPESMFGREVVVTSDPMYEDNKGRPVVMLDDIVVFQFMPKNDFDVVISIYEKFKARLGNFSDPQFRRLLRYCSKMNVEISNAFFYLREFGYKDIFDKLWHVMGGESMEENDRLGKRIELIRDLIEKFKTDKEKWAPELERLGLLK